MTKFEEVVAIILTVSHKESIAFKKNLHGIISMHTHVIDNERIQKKSNHREMLIQKKNWIGIQHPHTSMI